MESLYQIAKKLREEHKFNGYMHIKAIPGASEELIRKTGFYADRMSVNIELPSEKSLKLLAPDKKKDDIIKPMNLLGQNYSTALIERKKYKYAPKFVPAGTSTQMIIGASPESDLQIINLAESMYNKFSLKRVYYSAYIPINTNSNLPAISVPPLKRENRIYQADWLIRFYKFKANELLDNINPNFEEGFDPKLSWAFRHPEFFPVEINKASLEEIFRIPGIGVTSAYRIVKARRAALLNFDTLKKIGIVMKRAKYFITCSGKYIEHFENNYENLTQVRQ